jgi:hypothetical protein
MIEIRHKVLVEKLPNPLTGNSGEYYGRVRTSGTLNLQQIAESARNRGKAPLPADAIAIGAKIFLEEMAWLCCDGWSVNTGYFTLRPHFNGVFHSAQEEFDNQKHRISFDIQEGHILRKEAETIEVEVTPPVNTGISIFQVVDKKTGSINNRLTPERNLCITGNRIKVEGNDPAVGIYFINTSTQSRTKVDSTDIIINRAAEVVIIIPHLSTGTYQLEITTQHSSSRSGYLLNAPRTCIFDATLTVPAGIP